MVEGLDEPEVDASDGAVEADHGGADAFEARTIRLGPHGERGAEVQVLVVVPAQDLVLADLQNPKGPLPDSRLDTSALFPPPLLHPQAEGGHDRIPHGHQSARPPRTPRHQQPDEALGVRPRGQVDGHRVDVVVGPETGPRRLHHRCHIPANCLGHGPITSHAPDAHRSGSTTTESSRFFCSPPFPAASSRAGYWPSPSHTRHGPEDIRPRTTVRARTTAPCPTTPDCLSRDGSSTPTDGAPTSAVPACASTPRWSSATRAVTRGPPLS